MKNTINYLKNLFYSLFILEYKTECDCPKCSKELIVGETDNFDINSIPDEHFKDINLF